MARELVADDAPLLYGAEEHLRPDQLIAWVRGILGMVFGYFIRFI